MVKKGVQINSFGPVFPEESALIIRKILEKYGLAERDEKETEKLFDTANPKERAKIFESLAGVKISGLVKEYAEGKVTLIEVPSQIANRLDISEEKAKQIAQDLEKSLLSLTTPRKEKRINTLGEILLGEKPAE